jgi:glutaminyl-peptide cyclotransferase
LVVEAIPGMRRREAMRRSQQRRQRWTNQGHAGSQLFRFGIALAIVVMLALVAVLVLEARRSGAAEPPPVSASRGSGTGIAGGTPGLAERAKVEVLSTRPHDRGAFTQGLLLFEGQLYESTGQLGASTVREVDPTSGGVLRRVDLPPNEFGEGLARVGERLIQITWQNQVAHVYDLRTFAWLNDFTYNGEGWGICYDGTQLVMSDGSDTLFFRDPETFEVTGQVRVRLNGEARNRLNELECVGDQVYANIWQTDFIARIDKASGDITQLIDAAGLLAPEERPGTDVLNGIAYEPDTDTFLITGKWWPRLFQVRFVATG